jgi:hypothetical protein
MEGANGSGQALERDEYDDENIALEEGGRVGVEDGIGMGRMGRRQLGMHAALQQAR